MYDVIIIGAGVSGAAAARELSRYNAKVCVIEKEEDVCCGTSKANSAIVHAGYDAKEGSLMAKLNVRGNALMEQLSKDLDFPFKRKISYDRFEAEARLWDNYSTDYYPVVFFAKEHGIPFIATNISLFL